MCNPIAISHPHLVLADGVYKNYEWNVICGPVGMRCGYVRVPKGHPWHGKDYDSIEAHVHGGLTFAKPDEPCDKGGLDDGWWIGFDCAHAGDAQDPELVERFKFHPFPNLFDGSVKSQEYVEAECRQLIEQAIAISN